MGNTKTGTTKSTAGTKSALHRARKASSGVYVLPVKRGDATKSGWTVRQIGHNRKTHRFASKSTAIHYAEQQAVKQGGWVKVLEFEPTLVPSGSHEHLFTVNVKITNG